MFYAAVARIKAKEAAEKAALSNKTVSTWSADTKKATFTANGITQTMYVEKDGNAYNSDGNIVGKLEYGHITVTDSMYNALFGSGSGGTSNATVNVRAGDHVTSITTPDGSNATINSRGIIDTINTGKNSSLVLNNYGKINNSVNIGENGTAEINNYNKSIGPETGKYVIGIENITGKKDSKINVYNYGGIGGVHTGQDSENEVINGNEDAYVNWLETGIDNSTSTDEGTKKVTGEGKTFYKINGVKVPIDMYKKAEKEAKKLLDAILDVYYQYKLPQGYSIGDKTFGAEYESKYNDTILWAENQISLLKVFTAVPDLAYQIKAAAGETGNNYALQVLVGVKNYIDPNGTPSLKDLPSTWFIDGYYNKKTSKALEKKERINCSDYKYLVYSTGLFGLDNPRKLFIEKIEEKQNEIRNTPPLIYNTDKENKAYEQSLLYYLEKIQQMNKYYDTNKAKMDAFIDKIDEKY